MPEIGVGVHGTGWVAGEHIKSYMKNPQARVVALSSRTREGAQEKAREWLPDAMRFPAVDPDASAEAEDEPSEAPWADAA